MPIIAKMWLKYVLVILALYWVSKKVSQAIHFVIQKPLFLKLFPSLNQLFPLQLNPRVLLIRKKWGRPFASCLKKIPHFT